MPTDTAVVAGSVRSLDEHPHGFREHAHRHLRDNANDQFINKIGNILELPFWPTCRYSLPPRVVFIERCQRCGIEKPAGDDWWCDECAAVAEWLHDTRGLSPVQVCMMGESDPSPCSWVKEIAPWLIAPWNWTYVRADEK